MVGPIGDEYGEQAKHALEKGEVMYCACRQASLFLECRPGKL